MSNPEVFQLIDELSYKIEQLKAKAERAASGIPHILSDVAKLNIRQVHKILGAVDAELEIAWHREELQKARDKAEAHQTAIEKYNEDRKIQAKRTAFDVVAEASRPTTLLEQNSFGEEEPIARHRNDYPMADEPQPKWANPNRLPKGQ